MAAKITATAKKAKPKPYSVKGDTLAEVWESIKKVGPKDGGKDRAGFTKAPADLTVKKLKPDCNQNKEGKWVCVMKATDIVVTVSGATIQHPKLKSDKKLSAKAKTEWKRFMKELMEHEQEHIDTTLEAAKKVAQEVADFSATGEDADKKKAEKASHKAYVEAYKKKFTKTYMDGELDKANKALDSGGHGPTLDTSIP